MRGSLIKDCKIDVDELGKQIQERNAKDKNVFQNLIQETENDIESNRKSITLNWIALVFSMISLILNILQITVQHQKRLDACIADNTFVNSCYLCGNGYS